MNYHTGELTAYTIGEGLYRLHTQQVRQDWITSANEYVIASNGEFFLFLNEEETIGTLSREDIVARRKQIEAFMTNKKPKILKDWNGNIWLIMITGNISLEWTNEWGMGLVTFNVPWTEIGQPDNQNDLENCGMIDLGGD